MSHQHDPGMVPEEPWESDISSILAGLPPVEPPEGFIARALDHRPLFAGRVLVGLGGVVCVALGLSFVLGSFDRPLVVPEVTALAAQHAVTQAGVIPSESSTSVGKFQMAEENAGVTAIETSDDLDLRATLIAEEDLRQAVYARQSESVSIFSQPGGVKFDELPDGQRVRIDGVLAWVDPSGEVVVLETAEAAVTIVGLTPSEVAEAVEDIPRRSPTAGITELVNALTSEVGFPDLD